LPRDLASALETQSPLQPESKGDAAAESERSLVAKPASWFLTERELNLAAAFEPGAPRRAAPQLEFDSASTVATNSALSPAPAV
jgi:hypothetical protein